MINNTISFNLITILTDKVKNLEKSISLLEQYQETQKEYLTSALDKLLELSEKIDLIIDQDVKKLEQYVKEIELKFLPNLINLKQFFYKLIKLPFQEKYYNKNYCYYDKNYCIDIEKYPFTQEDEINFIKNIFKDNNFDQLKQNKHILFIFAFELDKQIHNIKNFFFKKISFVEKIKQLKEESENKFITLSNNFDHFKEKIIFFQKNKKDFKKSLFLLKIKYNTTLAEALLKSYDKIEEKISLEISEYKNFLLCSNDLDKIFKELLELNCNNEFIESLESEDKLDEKAIIPNKEKEIIFNKLDINIHPLRYIKYLQNCNTSVNKDYKNLSDLINLDYINNLFVEANNLCKFLTESKKQIINNLEITNDEKQLKIKNLETIQENIRKIPSKENDMSFEIKTIFLYEILKDYVDKIEERSKKLNLTSKDISGAILKILSEQISEQDIKLESIIKLPNYTEELITQFSLEDFIDKNYEEAREEGERKREEGEEETLSLSPINAKEGIMEVIDLYN